jgi:hypothetical protein
MATIRPPLSTTPNGRAPVPDVVASIIDELDQASEVTPAPEQDARPHRGWLTEEEVDQLAPPIWLVKHFIAAGEVTMVAGPGDAGKTMLAVDMTKRVAQYYRTMYIAAEDASGIKVRKRAWELHHRIPKNGNFLMWDGALALYNTEEVTSFIDEVRPLGVALIVIDTLSQSITGADENSAADMSIVMHNCQRIAHALGAAVLILHHTTKDGSNYRGSSVMKNNTYGFLEVTRDDDLIRLECVRIKNTKPGAPRFFRLIDVSTDLTDEAGDPVQSCVIASADRVIRTGEELTPARRKMLETLELMTDAQGGAKTTELQSVLGLNGNSFYGPLRDLRTQGLVEKGKRHTDPLVITEEGRQRLAAALNSTGNQPDPATSTASPVFEVNPHLDVLLPKLPGRNAMLPTPPGSIDSTRAEDNATGPTSSSTPTTVNPSTDAVPTNATTMLPPPPGRRVPSPTTTTSSFKAGSGSRNSGSNNGRNNLSTSPDRQLTIEDQQRSRRNGGGSA